MGFNLMLLISIGLIHLIKCHHHDRDEFIDLSYNMDKDTPVYLTFKPFQMNVLVNGTQKHGEDSWWVQAEEVSFPSHSATHIDAPCHFAKGKWSIADIPHDHLIDRPIAVVDVSQQCLSNRDYEATVDDVKEWESVNGKLPEDSVLIIKTGWARFWPIKLDYFGTEGNDPEQAHYPGVSGALAEWLVENRKIVGLGIDGPSVDSAKSKTKPTHRIMGERNIYNIENIAKSVHKLPPTGTKLIALPLKVTGASGTPATIVAYYSGVNHLIANAKLLLTCMIIIFYGYLYPRFNLN